MAEGLLPGACRWTFDLRVVAFCAAAALLVGLTLPGDVEPRGRATAFSTAEVIGPTLVRTTGPQRTTARAAGHHRGRSGGLPAVWCGTAASHAPRGRIVRSRLPRRQRPHRCAWIRWARVPRTEAALQQFYDQVEAGSAPCRRGRGRVGERSPLDFFVPAGSRSRSWATPRSTTGAPSTAYQVVSPTYFSTLDLPSSRAGRSKKSARYARRRAGVHRDEAFARTFRDVPPSASAWPLRPAPHLKPTRVREISVLRDR